MFFKYTFFTPFLLNKDALPDSRLQIETNKNYNDGRLMDNIRKENAYTERIPRKGLKQSS